MRAKSSTQYEKKSPSANAYSTSDYSDGYYLGFAGWKPGGSADCSNWKSSDGGYCSEKIPGDTSDNTGGSSGTAAHHYYDFHVNTENYPHLCEKKTKKVLSSSSMDIYYRPTIKVLRR